MPAAAAVAAEVGCGAGDGGGEAMGAVVGFWVWGWRWLVAEAGRQVGDWRMATRTRVDGDDGRSDEIFFLWK